MKTLSVLSTGLLTVYANSANDRFVLASELHCFLGVASRFTEWFNSHIEGGGLVQHQDYVEIELKEVPRDYAMRLDIAKHIAMLEDLSRGRAVRQFLNQHEKRFDPNELVTLYVLPDVRKWQKTFPDELFRQIYRLKGWPYDPTNALRMRCCGKIVNKYIYQQLPGGVLEYLRAHNPMQGGRRRYKHHQLLTSGIGEQHLKIQIFKVLGIMQGCASWRVFEKFYERTLIENHNPLQLQILQVL